MGAADIEHKKAFVAYMRKTGSITGFSHVCNERPHLIVNKIS